MKIFTCKESELPLPRPEILGEILDIDFQLNSLLLKVQGNYRELEKLAEVLSDSLDSCELNLSAIKIIADSSEISEEKTNSPEISMTQLPPDQQTVIFSSALFTGMLLSVVETLSGEKEAERLIEQLTESVDQQVAQCTQQEITKTLANFLKEKSENPEKTRFRVKLSSKD